MPAVSLRGAALDEAVALASPGLRDPAKLQRRFHIGSLAGQALNWVAAKAARLNVHVGADVCFYVPTGKRSHYIWDPLNNDTQLDRLVPPGLVLAQDEGGTWSARCASAALDQEVKANGAAKATAALRALSMAALGDEIELPESVCRRIALRQALLAIQDREREQEDFGDESPAAAPRPAPGR